MGRGPVRLRVGAAGARLAAGAPARGGGALPDPHPSEPPRHLGLSPPAERAGTTTRAARRHSTEGRLPAPDAVIGDGPGRCAAGAARPRTTGSATAPSVRGAGLGHRVSFMTGLAPAHRSPYRGPMILGHVVYKVTDLDAGVDDFRARGFAVEYGRPKNPINALAYFSEGPYFELLARTGTPKVLKKLTALVGGRRWRALSRLASWDDRAEGLCGLCLEGDSAQFRSAVRALNDDGLELGPHRTDTKGRTLRYRVFFPADPDLPFFMTHFSIDPRPSDFTHPNGVRRIASVRLPMPQDKHRLVRGLCEDEALILAPPDTAMRVAFDDGTVLEG